jgi:hypothetical protein
MLPEADVPKPTTDLTRRVLAFISPQLKLASVQVRWFTPHPERLSVPFSLPKQYDWRTTERAVEEFEFPKDPTGYTPASRKDEIWIKAGLEPLELIVVLTHELKHVQQRTFEYERFKHDEFIAEVDAYTFSAKATEEFLRSSEEASDAEIQKVRNFRERAIRDLAIDAIRAGLTPEQFRERLAEL